MPNVVSMAARWYAMFCPFQAYRFGRFVPKIIGVALNYQPLERETVRNIVDLQHRPDNLNIGKFIEQTLVKL